MLPAPHPPDPRVPGRTHANARLFVAMETAGLLEREHKGGPGRWEARRGLSAASWYGACGREEKIQQSLSTRLCKGKNNPNEPIIEQRPR